MEKLKYEKLGYKDPTSFNPRISSNLLVINLIIIEFYCRYCMNNNFSGNKSFCFKKRNITCSSFLTMHLG